MFDAAPRTKSKTRTKTYTKNDFLVAMKRGWAGLGHVEGKLCNIDSYGRTIDSCALNACSIGLGVDVDFLSAKINRSKLGFTTCDICGANNQAASKKGAIANVTALLDAKWPEGKEI